MRTPELRRKRGAPPRSPSPFGYALGLLLTAQVTLITARCLGAMSWSWWLIFIPAWVVLAPAAVMLLGVVLFVAEAEKEDRADMHD